jgi:3-dehydroquinate synthase
VITRLEVRLPSIEPNTIDRSYLIYIDPDAGAETRLAEEVRRRAASSTIGLITDETVAGLHWPRVEAALAERGLKVVTVVVPDGESSKSLKTVEEVADRFVRGGLDRRSLVVALGGGVVGDLGGFVASVFLRGVPYVQVPTTLLAQVDSSVGGKTGVNLASGKNLVGTFHQPLCVYADLTTLSTLPARDLSSGLAEIVKHGVIADEALLLRLEERAEEARAGDPALLAELVRRSCAIKAEVVATDERELLSDAPGGGRAQLNFGHTVGHALESASAGGPAPLRHGEAVALGMIAAARVGEKLGLGDPALEARLVALLPRLGLPTDLDRRLDGPTLERVGVDKKRAGGRVAMVLVPRIGQAALSPIEPHRLGEILLGRKAR